MLHLFIFYFLATAAAGGTSWARDWTSSVASCYSDNVGYLTCWATKELYVLCLFNFIIIIVMMVMIPPHVLYALWISHKTSHYPVALKSSWLIVTFYFSLMSWSGGSPGGPRGVSPSPGHQRLREPDCFLHVALPFGILYFQLPGKSRRKTRACDYSTLTILPSQGPVLLRWR